MSQPSDFDRLSRLINRALVAQSSKRRPPTTEVMRLSPDRTNTVAKRLRMRTFVAVIRAFVVVP